MKNKYLTKEKLDKIHKTLDDEGKPTEKTMDELRNMIEKYNQINRLK